MPTTPGGLSSVDTSLGLGEDNRVPVHAIWRLRNAEVWGVDFFLIFSWIWSSLVSNLFLIFLEIMTSLVSCVS